MSRDAAMLAEEAGKLVGEAVVAKNATVAADRTPQKSSMQHIHIPEDHLRAGNAAHLDALPETLSPMRRAAAESEARRAVVSASAASLAGEVSAARAELESADREVKLCAYGVLVAQAETLARELEAARAVVRDRKARLRVSRSILKSPLRTIENSPPPFTEVADAKRS